MNMPKRASRHHAMRASRSLAQSATCSDSVGGAAWAGAAASEVALDAAGEVPNTPTTDAARVEARILAIMRAR